MFYPYIYTGTRYHDFRVVTSQMLLNLPHSIKQYFEDVARTMIKAENSQLMTPSWILVKKDGYMLWGIAVLNKVLGNKCQDDDNRPVRGFFGFISDHQISHIPYDISYFKMLYDTYVSPIWDTLDQTQQIVKQMPPMFGDDFIGKSSRLNDDINFDNGICRIFPSTSESKSLLEAVLSAVGDCSIATNVHSKRQCVDFGKDKISFTNAVMSSDSKVNNTTDVKVYVPEKVDDFFHDQFFGKDIVIKNETVCPICGRPINANDDICKYCMNKQQNKKYIKYALYGFIALTCWLILEKGTIIWEKLLSTENPHEKIIPLGEVEKPSPNSEITIAKSDTMSVVDSTVLSKSAGNSN